MEVKFRKLYHNLNNLKTKITIKKVLKSQYIIISKITLS